MNSTPISGVTRVAVVTPTCGRQTFLHQAYEYFINQHCPGLALCWFILDDSPDPDPFLSNLKLDAVSYRWRLPRMPLGAKRNLLNDMALAWDAEFICAMDDDDWYGPSYVCDMINMLRGGDLAFAGCSQNYYYHVPTGDIFLARTAPPMSSGNGVLCFRSAVLKDARYPDGASSGEDRAFLGDRAVQQHADISKVHLALIHEGNTEDKSTLLGRAERREDLTLASFAMREEDARFYRALTAAG